MWISHHKRIFLSLWHTARNILAIFYMLQHITIAGSCRTDIDVQSRAILSQIVIAGKVITLDLTQPPLSTEYDSYTAVVQVLSVIKQPESQQSSTIHRKQYLTINGFIKNSSLATAAQFSSSATNINISSNSVCLSHVNQSQDYILFINRTDSENSQDRPSYHTAQISSKYTKTDKKLIKDVLCTGCATSPNAKSKRNLEISEGESNYKISCRVQGNPPPQIHWVKDGEVLDNSRRGIAVKHRRKKHSVSLSIRIKNVKKEHAGVYKCIAKNILGEDTAKTRLTVVPSTVVKGTPPPPGGMHIWESINIDEDSKESIEQVSHYIPCTGRDRNYCLHGGECRVFPDGRYKHCRCLARFTGSRCEEANFRPPTPKPFIQATSDSLSEKSMELTYIIITLASVLVVLVILLLIMAFYWGGKKFRSQREKRLNNLRYISVPLSDTIHVQDEPESKHKSPSVKQCQTTASQTEPMETSLQQIRKSLNLENHFPHSSSDLMLRRKSMTGSPARPVSQPIEKRPTRHRLSATSTITEQRGDGSERVPSSASTEPDGARSVSSCDGNTPHQAHCDHESTESISLHISESTSDSDDSNRRNNNKIIENPYRGIIRNGDLLATNKIYLPNSPRSYNGNM